MAPYGKHAGIVGKGDLYAVRRGDPADAPQDSLRQAADYFMRAQGEFTESTGSHLWVKP